MEINKIYNCDNAEILKTLPDKSIDLFLEDMPYNTTQSEFEYEVNLKEYWELRLSKIKNSGVFLLFADEPFTSKLILSNLDMFIVRITWDKKTDRNALNAYKMPLKRTEDIVLFSPAKIGNFIYNLILKNKPKYNIRPKKKYSPNPKSCYGFTTGENSKKNDNNKKYPNNLIEYSASEGECNPINRIHVNQKPINLFRYLIKTYTNKGMLVFDGYAGSFTTAIACIIEDRNYICCETGKNYYEQGKKRIEIEKQQLKLEYKQ